METTAQQDDELEAALRAIGRDWSRLGARLKLLDHAVGTSCPRLSVRLHYPTLRDAIRAFGSRGELEQVHVSVDGEWCMITARAIEGPLPDTLMLTGPLLPRSPSLVRGVDDVLSSLEHWRDHLSDPETIGSTDHAADIRRELSYLVRAVAQQFDNRWSQAIVRSRGTGRHHVQLRLAGDASGSTEMNFVSGTRRSGAGGMSSQLVEAIDGIIGDHTHVSAWNGACPADRLPVTIGSTPFVDVGEEGRQLLESNVQLVNRMVTPADIRAAERIEPFDLARAIDGWSDGQNRRAANPFKRA